MIHRVTLENFGPHASFDRVFGPGVTLIIGPNGAGKSHIVRGIGWIITGTSALDRPQKEYIRDGAKSMSGSVEIDILGRKHCFTRSFQRSASASLEVDGEVVARTVGGVQEYLASLNFDSDALSVLIAMQDELSDLITITPARRKEIIEKLTRTESVKEAQDLARAESVVSVVEPTGDVKVLREAVVEHQDRVAKFEEAITENEEALALIDGEIQNLRKQLTDLPKPQVFTQLGRYHEVRTLHPLAAGEVKQLQEQLAGLPPAAPDGAEGTLKVLADELEEVTRELDYYTSVNQELADNIQSWQLQAEIAERSSRDVTCPSCGHSFCDVHEPPSPEDLQNWERLKVKCLEKLEGAAASYNNLVLRTEELERSVASQLERDRLSGQLQMAAQREEELRIELADLTVAYEEYQANSTPPESGKTLAAELQARETRADQVRRGLSDFSQALGRAKLDVSRSEELLATYLERQEAYESAVQSARIWKDTTKALGSFRERILQDALVWVSARASQILQRVGTIQDVSPQSRLELTSNLDFYLVDESGKIPISRFSGGQKAAFSICLRIALADYFSDRLGLQGLLVLDAVFESMDQENREATAAALSSAGPQQAIIFAYEDLASLQGERVQL